VKINNETLGNPTLRGGARPEAPLRLPAAGIQAVMDFSDDTAHLQISVFLSTPRLFNHLPVFGSEASLVIVHFNYFWNFPVFFG
jgi:hypothetical protein